MRLFVCLCVLIFLLHGQVNCLSSFSSNSSSTQLCPHDQSLALLQLKNNFSFDRSASTCDQSYPKMLSWEENADCCSWDGVTCDTVTGHIISLDLNCSWLQGTIHSNSSLFLLPHLQRLNLAFNDFNYSQISSRFGGFASLTHLNLSSSVFSGLIPSEIFHLSKLISLDLSFNYDRSTEINLLLRLSTSELKNLVQNLTELRELDLGGVNMSSIELDSLSNLHSSLKTLSLKNCGLQGKFPNDAFRLPNLQKLDLSYNYNLTVYFPKDNWSNTLKFLDLSSLDFSKEVPNSISNLQSLNYLALSSCSFSGSIPGFLGNITKITHLDLSYNNFKGEISSSMSNLGWLSFLDLSDNKFNGSIPAWFGNLTQMSYLELSYNNFSGEIPLSLSKLDQLTHLYLSNNHFNGLIPTWFGNFTKLNSLDLSSNNFSGQMPSWLSNFSQLSYLQFSSNNLSGSIPSSLLEFRQLYYLNLSINHFSDFSSSSGEEKLPAQNLQYLDLHSNTLAGKIPSLICNASSLKILNLFNNNLSGTIPQCLGNVSKYLSVLDLRMNSFHGTIPKTFVKGNALRNIALNGNQLKGPVPLSISNCRQLQVLDLGNNMITDTFPYWLEILPELQVLVLRSNKFHGSIRSSKFEHPFPMLRIFDISNNDFSGPLPTKYFKNLKSMMNVNEKKYERRYMGDQLYHDSVMVTIKGFYIELVKILTIFTALDLSSNKFEGEIPKLTGNLTSLRLLNFSHNNLRGQIPSSIGNLRNLESLDLSSNNLNGQIPKELISLNFLSFLNLSQNHLVGSIPQGPHFDTFENKSYSGNSELCGGPLSKKCSRIGDEVLPQPSPFVQPKEDNNVGFFNGFDWKLVVVTGYGCRTVFGLILGCFIFLIEKTRMAYKDC